MARALCPTLCLCLVLLVAAEAHAGPADTLRTECGWLDRAIAHDPGRDDAFGMLMRGMKPKCTGALEGVARGDGSVTDETLVALSKELAELRSVVGDAPAPPKSKRDKSARKATKVAPAPKPQPALAAEKKSASPAAAERSAKAVQPVVAPEPVKPETPRTVKLAPAPQPAPRPIDQVASGAAKGGATATEVNASSVAQEGVTPPEAAFKGVGGTWKQAPRKVLDKNIKRTLNLFDEQGAIEGELYEEVWFKAPLRWIDTSCNGNDTFRMVTTARVTGGREGRELSLRRDIPRILACSCPSRCRTEKRRRGLSLALSPSMAQLSDNAGVFVRQGVPDATAAAGADQASAARTIPVTFAGNWETEAFTRRGKSVTMRLELDVTEGRASGTLTESFDQALPLKSWADRFCDGEQRFAYVHHFDVNGKVRKRSLTLRAKKPRVLTCTCEPKCRTPKRRRALRLKLTPDGRNLVMGDVIFERR